MTDLLMKLMDDDFKRRITSRASIGISETES